MSNKIVFAPAVALATVIASRSEQSASHTPSFVSATFVTTKGGKLTVCVTVLLVFVSKLPSPL